MKILRYIVLVLTMLFSLTVCARAEEFIFKYKENAVVPYSRSFDPVYVADEFFACDNEEMLKALLEAGVIEYYEPNVVFELMEATNDPEYNPQSRYEFLWTKALPVVNNGKYNGRGVKVGIIDTGLADGMEDIDYTKVVARRNVTVNTNSVEFNNLTAEQQQQLLTDVTDNHGHGTAVAGVIAAKTNNGVAVASLAPEVNLVIIKAFEGNTSGIIELAKAVDYAISEGCDVINMSLGAIYQKNQIMEDMINKAEKAGVIVVAAAGNHEVSPTSEYYYEKYTDKDSPLMYPAAYPNVISVASINNMGNYSYFSYHNKGVNIAACGTAISTLNHNNPSMATERSGTSFACPFVTSVAALAKQIRPDITVSEFMQLISETATDRGEAGWDTHYGSGIINVGLVMDTMLGPDITVGAVFMNDDNVPSVAITNNGFAARDVMDIWYTKFNGGTFNRRVKTVSVEPKSVAVVTYDVGVYTVCHMAWLKEWLMPLCKKEEFITGISF